MHTLIDKRHPQLRRTIHTDESVSAVNRKIDEDPNESIRYCVYQLELRSFNVLW